MIVKMRTKIPALDLVVNVDNNTITKWIFMILNKVQMDNEKQIVSSCQIYIQKSSNAY